MLKLPIVTTRRVDERGRYDLRVHKERVGEVFPVVGGWHWRVEDNEHGIPPRDTQRDGRKPYGSQGEAEDAAKRYARHQLKTSHAA